MPVILQREAYGAWLNEKTDVAGLKDLLRQYPAGATTAENCRLCSCVKHRQSS
jgi:putative SOS response-associated peptidase YedK